MQQQLTLVMKCLVVCYVAVCLLAVIVGFSYGQAQQVPEQPEQPSLLQQELDNFMACQAMNINHNNRQRVEWQQQLQKVAVQLQQCKQQAADVAKQSATEKGDMKSEKDK
jgi:Lon protease-like protein